MSDATRGPWVAFEHFRYSSGGILIAGYIEIRGPSGEAICNIFPDAGKGGVGMEEARANARLIVDARDAALREVGG